VRTVCIDEGDATPFVLVLMSYEITDWILAGYTGRVSELRVWAYDGIGDIVGNDDIPTETELCCSGPCDPYDYSDTMGDCVAHTGYSSCVYDVAQDQVCHMELGLYSECSYPEFTCLRVDP